MDKLTIYQRPLLSNPSLLVGFTGWMDGGDVSSGSVAYLQKKFAAEMIAEIDPQEFYLFNFPGSMEEVAQFRPYTLIKEGIITEFHYPQNQFFCASKENLLLFLGKEPNMKWNEYVENIFFLGKEFGVKRIYFIGSVSGLIPHTREPRVTCSVSDERLKKELEGYNLYFNDYEGPASITTLLTLMAPQKGVEMINLVVEIPMYIQATNPKGISSALGILSSLLNLPLVGEDLVNMSEEFDRNVEQLVKKYPDLVERIKKLEENYDREILEDDQNFREWLRRHGIDKI
ncbi:MAG TPA: PAC2 family protein [Candidatus Atribacteria bacterium]|jgi:proteasome assembly chaperone (PAC2) family protein|uniref:PAC2 family protein n=1 Tax=Candidatus Sordicultor fermentans TaxID=1953203 RepID=UPI0016906D76|nr:PAC2 family protein [Atribacterota bacterium]NLY05501.1 PAC2 family protein [Candidatus Atribacteria bacterium]MDI9607874.1 PAC2 family protein [Atribacterota bacterium]MDY0135318.1 PAC2 family protein [Atribacterota bacterium]HOA99364.1 PAC2 family protein [Candidatus Atribacteria bacterium]